MINKSIVLVKGISGSGKSTRVHLFLEFIKKMGFQVNPFFITNHDGDRRQIGMHIVDMNMICIGKYYTDGGVTRWQGLDSMTSRFGDSAGLSSFIENAAALGFNILLDGAGTTATWRLRPQDLITNRGIKNILFVRYDYTEHEKDAYYERIKYRSGKVPNSDSMWDKSHNFANDYLKAVEESKEFSLGKHRIQLHDLSYTSPTYDLGANILAFFECEDLIDEFIAFCNESEYIKMNSFENFENGKNK